MEPPSRVDPTPPHTRSSMYPTLDTDASPVEALAFALFLALVAPTEAHAAFAACQAKTIARGMAGDDVQAAKARAVRLRDRFRRFSGL
jgi:hypothetical protein